MDILCPRYLFILLLSCHENMQYVHCYKSRCPKVSDRQQKDDSDLYIIHEISVEQTISPFDFVGVLHHKACRKYDCFGHHFTELWEKDKGQLNGDRLDLQSEIEFSSRIFKESFEALLNNQLPTTDDLKNITEKFDECIRRIDYHREVVNEIYTF